MNLAQITNVQNDFSPSPISAQSEELYLYLDRDVVVHIPTFTQLSCLTNPGGYAKTEPIARSGAVVAYKGQDMLMLCGGYWEDGCQVWTEEEWVGIEGEFER